MSRDAVLIGGSLAAMIVVIAQLLDFGYGRDQGIYATVAHTLLNGGVPYRDAWDFKPPGIFFVYALAERALGPHIWSIRVLEACVVLTLLPAFAIVSRQYLHDGRPGIFGGALAVVTYVQMEFWNTAQPESFGAVVVAWGLVAATAAMNGGSGNRSRARGLWAMCGVCFGAAATLKPTIALAGLASLGLGLALRAREDPTRSAWRHLVEIAGPFAAGALGVITACAAVFASRGALDALIHAVFVFAPRYASLAWKEQTAFELLWDLLRGSLVTYSWTIPVGLGLLIVRKPPELARRGLLHVGAAVALLVVGVAVQARLYVYHFSPVVCLTALLAGWGFWGLWLEIRERMFGAVAFGLLLVSLMSAHSATWGTGDPFGRRCWLRFVAWAYPSERVWIRDRLYTGVDYDAKSNRLAREWLTRETDPQSAVYVYGFTPELYLASGRRAASRYIHNVPQRADWSRDAAREELLVDLARSRPSAVLVENGDIIPTVTSQKLDSAGDLRGFSELRAWLADRYERVARIGKFDVYRAIP